MEKRAFERLTAALKVEYYYCDNVYSGTVRNRSQKDMFINTNKCFPLDSTSVIFINKKRLYETLYESQTYHKNKWIL